MAITVPRIAWVGEKIADERYKILAQLGEGGMGTVFRAYDMRLETEVVIKCPLVQSLDEAFRQRFEREIRSLVRLSHPHVVRVLDVGRHDDIPFFVMQYLAGGSLKSRIYPGNGSPQPQSPRSLKKWLPQIAAALDFTHQQNYVHRDVKPANILFDEHGNAFLSDFGLTRVLADQKETFEQQQLTESGHFVGTVHYVSPEAVMGREVDGRADQYSLAIAVYESLTGVLPFTGPTSSAVLVKQTSQRAAPLHERVKELPPELSEVLGQALSKRAAQRFATCDEFAEAVLEHCHTSRAAGTENLVRPDGVIVSRGERGNVPCPKCRRILSMVEAFAGKKAVCQYCRTRILISADLCELSTLPSPVVASSAAHGARDTSAGDQASSLRTAASAHGATAARHAGDASSLPAHPAPHAAGGTNSDELIVLDERLFGYRISRRQATAVGVALLLVFMSAVGFVAQRFTQRPSVGPTRSQDAAEERMSNDVSTPAAAPARVELSVAGPVDALNAVRDVAGHAVHLNLALRSVPAEADQVIHSVMLGDRNLTVHAWLVDHAIDRERLDAAWRRTHAASLFAASHVLAWTPLVFATTKERIHGYRTDEIAHSIDGLLKLEADPPAERVPDADGSVKRRRALHLRLPHPATSKTGRLALWQMACELQAVPGAPAAEEFRSPAYRGLLNRAASAWLADPAPAAKSPLDELFAADARFDFTMVDERTVLEKVRDDARAGDALRIVYPQACVGRELTLCVLDAPWVSAEQRAAAGRLAEYLLSPESQRKLFAAGWRAMRFSIVDAGDEAWPKRYPAVGFSSTIECRDAPPAEAAEALFDLAETLAVGPKTSP